MRARKLIKARGSAGVNKAAWRARLKPSLKLRASAHRYRLFSGDSSFPTVSTRYIPFDYLRDYKSRYKYADEPFLLPLT